MDLDAAEVGYFITQVGLSAASFGVATADVTAVGMALNAAFGYKCAPPVMIVPGSTAELQAICIADDCPLSPNATCAAYAKAVEPATATGSAMASSTGSTTGSAMSSATMTTKNAAGGITDTLNLVSVAVVLIGAIGFAFAL